MKLHSQKFLQRRKFFMVLPLLVLPFLTMIFWALGGGKEISQTATAAGSAGLNASLPDAYFSKGEVWNKLELYEMAERDSAKYNEARERDPYFDLIAFETGKESIDTAGKNNQNNLNSSFPQKEKQLVDPNEEKVNRKLEELYREIHRPAVKEMETAKSNTRAIADPQFSADVDRLEKMMELMKEDGEHDPEMQQIENVLEKILDIQHPERVKERLRSADQHDNTNTLQVETIIDNDNITTLGPDADDQLIFPNDSSFLFQDFSLPVAEVNGFYGLDGEASVPQNTSHAIEAIIHDTQQIVSGSTIKMRLLSDVHINGMFIPQNEFIYGTCTINDERLHVEIKSIRTGTALFPVSLTAYDIDGLEGIYIPGAITRDAARQASDNALQNIQLMSLDQSLSAQAATAGVEAAKGLFSKKARQVKVTVKAGYQVLLKNANESLQ